MKNEISWFESEGGVHLFTTSGIPPTKGQVLYLRSAPPDFQSTKYIVENVSISVSIVERPYRMFDCFDQEFPNAEKKLAAMYAEAEADGYHVDSLMKDRDGLVLTQQRFEVSLSKFKES